MKKSYNPISDGNNEKNELTRRIYRSLSEVVRQLDDIRGRSKTIADLFLPCLGTLRIRLHDLCYKLILTDPLGYGKKGEELLWKKGYHDVFTTAKRLRKNDKWSPQEAGIVQGLLISGLGHYQHLLFKLQSDYKVDIQGLIDFPISISDLGLTKAKPSQQKLPDKNLEDWAKDSCHRCLVYLGDLNRYLLDIFPLWDSGTAERYYLQAANMNINCGRPFNQLGTLAGSKNYNLDAVYHYIRCIIRPEPFEGAEANLRKALDKNIELTHLDSFSSDPAPAIQKLISKFLFLFDFWYFEKSVDYDIHVLCQEMLHEFQLCLNDESGNSFQLDPNELELSNITPFRVGLTQRNSLNSDMILKIIVLTLICIDKLQRKDYHDTSVVIALYLELFTQLLQQLVTRFQRFYLQFGITAKTLESALEIECHKSEGQNDSESISSGHELCKEKNKGIEVNCGDKPNGYTTPQSVKKCLKYSDKKRNKNDHHQNSNIISRNLELSDLNVTDSENLSQKLRKKGKLKRRKRVRPDSLCDSEMSDSDATVNDSTSGNEFSSGDSDSDEVISSDSEGLDETLLIIDQKIKEKKKKKDEKNCDLNGIIKSTLLNMDSKELVNGSSEKHNMINDISDKESGKVTSDQNGVKVPSEKDKTKSLFTILNGVGGHTKLTEKSGGDFTHNEKLNSKDSISYGPIQFSKAENKEHGDFSTEEKSDVLKSNFCPKNIDAKDLTHFLVQQESLKAVRICCDWLVCNQDVLKTGSKYWKPLSTELVVFLNLIKFGNESVLKDIESNIINVPLCEDISLRGLPMLKQCHEKLDWEFHKTHNLANKEEILRLRKFIEFGHFLVKHQDAGIMYNKNDDLFYIVRQNGMTNPSLDIVLEKQVNNNMKKGQLMKNMGQLWLKAEVRDLESRVRKKSGNFSPYLVIDSEALIEHIVLVKQLVGSRQFIVIIPTVVLSHLDECKRDSGRARETIRWLESQFQHGNRSLRAQKSQERFSLPLIKYPKKKDKEAWNFFQIVECCHYFSKQSEFQSCHTNLLVTLLTGQRDIIFTSENKKEDFGKDYSPMGVAKNFGINLEHIEAFHTKWKLSTKSHG